MFKMEFEITDATQSDGLPDVWAVSDLIKFVADKVHDGFTSGIVTDANGNSVGTWRLDQ